MFSSGGPSVRFLTRYDGEVSEPLGCSHWVEDREGGGKHCFRIGNTGQRASLSLLAWDCPGFKTESPTFQKLPQGGWSPKQAGRVVTAWVSKGYEVAGFRD